MLELKRIEKNELEVRGLLMERGTVGLRDIMDSLGVSESTARRLFSKIEADGLAVRVFGGLRRIPEYSFEALEKENADKKRTIGEYAATLVENGDVIFADSGTTTLFFATALAERMKNSEITQLRVVTASHASAEVLGKYTEVYVTGGRYRAKRRDVAGSICESELRNMKFTKFFAGADAINESDGLMATDGDTKAISETVMQNSQKTVVLADSTKFGRVSLVSFCNDFSRICMIVTDSGLDKSEIKKYNTKIQVV